MGLHYQCKRLASLEQSEDTDTLHVSRQKQRSARTWQGGGGGGVCRGVEGSKGLCCPRAPSLCGEGPCLNLTTARPATLACARPRKAEHEARTHQTYQ